MFEDGYEPLSNSVCQILYQAMFARPTTVDQSQLTVNDRSVPTYQQSSMLHQLTTSLPVYALRNAAWSEFWNLWRSFPCRMSPRSSDMYVIMFEEVAKTNSQKDAMDALRQYVPEMLREQPAIRLGGQVATAILRCLQVAEPRAEKLARQGNRGEWAVLWLRCAKALEAA